MSEEMEVGSELIDNEAILDEATEGSVEAGDEAGAEAVATAAKRAKKLSKGIDGLTVIIKVLDGEAGEMKFDTSLLPDNVKEHLVPFGAGHKLGDSAAGRTGKEAEDAIQKVWEGLMKGDFTVRAPAAPKVSTAEVKNALENMGEEERARAQELLAKMGFKF